MSKAINTYLNQRAWQGDHLIDIPSDHLCVIICIPMRNEGDPCYVLSSLLHAGVARKEVEVIIGVNHSENSPQDVIETNRQCLTRINQFIEEQGLANVRTMTAFQLPAKKSGVGLARKIIMDEALRRYVHLDKKDGLIVALDADCKVDDSYIEDLIALYEIGQGQMAFSFGFAHDIEAVPSNKTAIVKYEKHLRLYRERLLNAGHPHSQYTVGSAMACTAIGYASQSGMNTRQAGEDFYFLQKFIKAGYHRYLPEIVVRPTGRVSDRVPFGTGRAMLKYEKEGEVMTYHPKSYDEIAKFIAYCHSFDEDASKYQFPLAGKIYGREKVIEELSRIKKETSTREAFRKRFFQWFDAFQAMKMLHWLRDQGFPDVPVLIDA